jgi:hypothetical protein
MSQSDYIKYKRTSRVLKEPAELDPVLSPSEYMAYKDYNLENTVTNSKPTYNNLTPTGKQIVFGMERAITGCPTFALCNDTNARPNRRAIDAGQSTCFPVMKAPGRSVPIYNKKPTFSTYVRKNYRVLCECKDTTCTGSRSRACRMKYGCTC